MNPVTPPEVNYMIYSEAIANANDGDTIKIWQNNVNTITFTYKRNVPLADKFYNYMDNASVFLYTVLNANNTEIANIRNNKTIYLDYNNNKFKLGTITNTNAILSAGGDFKGGSITLDTNKHLLPANRNLLVGITDKMAYPTKEQDLGFFVKYIDTTNFNVNDDTVQNISVLPLTESSNINFKINLPNYHDDMNKSTFINKMLNLSDDLFIRPLNLKIIKNFSKNFNLQLPKDGIYMLLDPGHYAEYAVNLTSRYNGTNQPNDFNLEHRSFRELTNGNAAPMKGQFNGWRYAKTTQNIINWTLYDKRADADISSQTLIYFWIAIYQPNPTSQTFHLEITNSNNYTDTINVTTTAAQGRFLLWYSPTANTQPTSASFDLIKGTETNIRVTGSTLNNISKVKLKTTGTNLFYLESYGYSTNQSVVNLALRGVTDPRLTESKQISLSTQNGYEVLINKIINSGSSYPMDIGGNDTDNPIIEEATNGSIGWYFDSSKDFSMNLVSKENINSILKRPTNQSLTYNDFHTMFVEVIIKQHTTLTIDAFGQHSIPINDIGQKIIYMKNSPFSAEPYVVPPTSSFATNLIPHDPNVVYSGVDVGVHKYRVTYFTDVGETLSGPDDYSSTIAVLDGQGYVILSSLPLSNDPRVKGRNIYRTTKNDILSVYRLVTQIFDNTTTQFTDMMPDYQLGKVLPTTNTASAGTIEPYFSQLNPDVANSLDNFNLFIPVEYIQDAASFTNLLINASNNTDVEIISYGYKLRGYPPIHMQTRWTSIVDSPLINNINGYLTIEKDAFSIAAAQDTIVDAKFKVIAYGDFVRGNYLQNPLTNEYADIRVNVSVNKLAVQNALYMLDKADLNNYTIKVDGLTYQSRGVGIIDANGVMTTNNMTLSDTKYIMGDLTIKDNNEATYIDTSSNMKIFRRNGGLNPVLLEGVYAAMFKAFNKSGSILNPNMLSSISNLASEVIKPNIPIGNLTTQDSTNLEEGATYTYRITYYTDTGETECSLESNPVVQSVTSRKKILITIPVSQDSRVLGRKIYRKKLDSDTYHYYIATVNNNVVNSFLDDIVNPLNGTVQAPSLAYLTSNDSSYSQLTAARTLVFKRSLLAGSTNYQYCVSYYKTVGNNVIQETLASDTSDAITTSPDPCMIIVNLPISPDGGNITGRYLYRKNNVTNRFGLVGVIPDNVTTIFVDNIPESSVDMTAAPLTTSTLPGVAKPILTAVGNTKFTYLYTKEVSYNLISNAAYKYKFTYVVSNTVNGTTVLGETDGSAETNTVYQPVESASKVLLNLPIGIGQNIVKRNIYRTTASGTIFKFLATVDDNVTSVYIDNIADTALGNILPVNNTTTTIAPLINTTRSLEGNMDPLNYLLANSFNEVNVPAFQSTIFKLYNYSGRFAKDQMVYSSNMNSTVGTSVNGINSSGSAIADGTQIYNTVNMNLENMELNIKCKLRGALYNTSNNNPNSRTPLTKEIAEFIFGRYNTSSSNGVVNEPDTLIREVTRVGNNTYGLDVLGYKMDMLNNEKNLDGTYKILKEIQYEIVFVVGLIQKTSA